MLLLPAFSSFLSLSISDCAFGVLGSVGFSSFTAPDEEGAFGAISGAFFSFGVFCAIAPIVPMTKSAATAAAINLWVLGSERLTAFLPR